MLLFRNAPLETAWLLVEEGAVVDVCTRGGDKPCALALSMGDDANWDCTQLIFQKHPDIPEALVKMCVHHAFKYGTRRGLKTL